jgi:hypothetical protein
MTYKPYQSEYYDDSLINTIFLFCSQRFLILSFHHIALSRCELYIIKINFNYVVNLEYILNHAKLHNCAPSCQGYNFFFLDFSLQKFNSKILCSKF